MGKRMIRTVWRPSDQWRSGLYAPDRGGRSSACFVI